MSLIPSIVIEQWQIVLLIVPLSMLVKGVLIYASARLFSTAHDDAIRTAGVLTQHGEFAFVLFSASMALGVISRDFASLMIAAVILSMALTPLSVAIAERLVRQRATDEPDENFEGAGSKVLIVGFSRMAQVASQTLLASGIDVTIIDNDPERIRTAARFGFRIYFGDGTRADVLRAAGIEKSSLVAITTGHSDVTTRVATLIRAEWPEMPLYVRAYDRIHALELMSLEVKFFVRETFESALVLGGEMLEGLGRSPQEVRDVVEDTRRRDEERLRVQASDGVHAGGAMLHTRPVRPEPLVAPRGEAAALDQRSREILMDQRDETDETATEPETTR
jgi:CPA2 family monovalent cation:H+ antiporter-2